MLSDFLVRGMLALILLTDEFSLRICFLTSLKVGITSFPSEVFSHHLPVRSANKPERDRCWACAGFHTGPCFFSGKICVCVQFNIFFIFDRFFMFVFVHFLCHYLLNDFLPAGQPRGPSTGAWVRREPDHGPTIADIGEDWGQGRSSWMPNNP